jgi:hypothetical protein
MAIQIYDNITSVLLNVRARERRMREQRHETESRERVERESATARESREK